MKKHWKKHWMMGFGLAALLLGAGAALAEPATVKGNLDERIDMALKKASPDDLFKTFAQMFGAEAVVDPAVREPVSIELHNVRARTLLDTICESIGCRWSLEPGDPPKLRVTPTPVPAGGGAEAAPKPTLPKEPIDLKVTNADVQELLRTFGQILGVKAVIDPSFKGTVSFDLRNTPCNEALDAVCLSVGCDWSLEGGVLRVFPKTKRK